MNRRDLLATSAAALAAGALPVSARTPGAPMPQNRPVPPVAKKIPMRSNSWAACASTTTPG